MKLLNSIKNFFKTPAKTSIKRRFNNWFKFYNSELANNETIFSAVTMKANAIASAPVSINLDYRKLNPGEHKLAYLFKYGPNPRQTMFSFIQYMEATRNTNSGAYAIIEYSNVLGDISAIWPLKSEFVEPIIDQDSGELYYEITDHDDNTKRYVHNSHVIALEYLDNNGFKGINPLNVLKNTIDYDREIKEFSINQMKTSLKANAVVKIDTTLDEESLEEYDAMMEQMQENGIIYLDDGKDIKELSAKTYIDPNIFDVEKITVERVERVFNIIGKLTKGSSANKTTSSDTEDLLYLKDSILPVIRQYEQEFSKKLLTTKEKMQGYEIKFNMQGYARATMEKRGNFYQQMIRNGIFSPNFCAMLEDAPPHEGGDKYYMSRDLCPVELYDEFIKNSITKTSTNLNLPEGGETVDKNN